MSKIEDWKVEDEGVIIGDKYSGHGFACGDKVVVKSVNKENGDLTVYNYGVGETRWVDVRDIEKDNMIVDEKEQFRICDILGVDVGQEFEVEREGYEGKRIFINSYGEIDSFSEFLEDYGPDEIAIYAINYPESIKICPNEEDKEYAQKIYDVFGRDGLIERMEDGTLIFRGIIIQDIGFKKLKPGNSVKLSELIDIS